MRIAKLRVSRIRLYYYFYNENIFQLYNMYVYTHLYVYILYKCRDVGVSSYNKIIESPSIFLQKYFFE